MTYTPPSFAIQFDLNRDGVFETDAVRDVTDRTGGLHIKRGMGRDGIYQVSELQFSLDNSDGAWTPEYPSATYFGQMGIDVPVRITATHSAIGYTLWTGYVQRWTVHTRQGIDAEVQVRAADIGKYLVDSAAINVAISKVRDTDGAIQAVLDALGLVAGDYSLDDGIQDLAYSYAIGEQAMAAIMGFARAELGGLVWINAAGQVRFESRNSRLGTTVDDTWGDGTDVTFESIDYEIMDQDIITQANVRGTRHIDGIDGEEVFRFALGRESPTGQSLQLTAGQVYVRRFKLSAPVLSIYEAAATKDYQANDNADGSGTNRTANQTVSYTLNGSGEVEISITNGHSGSVYITLCRVRGQVAAFYADRPEAVYALAVPGRKAGTTFSLDVPWVQADATALLDYAAQLVHTYRQPWPRVTVTIGWGNDTTVVAMLSVELGDLIRIRDTAAAQWGTNVDEWCYVESIEHVLVPGREMRSVISLVPSYLYRKLDRIVYDDFARADATGDLGTSRSGDAWVNDGSMNIASQKARANADAEQQPYLELGAGATDQAVEASLAAMAGDDEAGINLRQVDASNLYRYYYDYQAQEVVAEREESGTVWILGDEDAATIRSGNEITQAVRQRATDGDGRAATDESIGVYPAATNICTNGGFETNTTGWANDGSAVTLTRTTSEKKFGTASGSLAFTGAGGYVVNRSGAISGATAGRIFSESIWIKAAGATIGKTANLEIYESGGASGAANTSFPLVVSGEWQEVKGSRTLVANDRTAVEILVSLTSSANGDQLYIDGGGVTETAVPQPYIETGGGTAARSAGRVRSSASDLAAAQGWIAIRVRMNWAAASRNGEYPGFFRWRVADGDASNQWLLFVDGGLASSNVLAKQTLASAATQSAGQTWNFAAGDTGTVIMAWTATAMKFSLNGAAFGSTAISSMGSLGTLFDICLGDSDILAADAFWVAVGTGTLTDANAATIHAYGNTAPTKTALNDAIAAADCTRVIRFRSALWTPVATGELRGMLQGDRFRGWADSKLTHDCDDEHSGVTTGTKAGLYALRASGSATFDNFYAQSLV